MNNTKHTINNSISKTKYKLLFEDIVYNSLNVISIKYYWNGIYKSRMDSNKFSCNLFISWFSMVIKWIKLCYGIGGINVVSSCFWNTSNENN